MSRRDGGLVFPSIHPLPTPPLRPPPSTSLPRKPLTILRISKIALNSRSSSFESRAFEVCILGKSGAQLIRSHLLISLRLSVPLPRRQLHQTLRDILDFGSDEVVVERWCVVAGNALLLIPAL